MTEVYVVGSAEDHFVADRVYDDKAKAVEYCESRRCERYVWVVKAAPIGGPWHEWNTIHRTERSN